MWAGVIEDVKGDADAAGDPLQGFPELFNPEYKMVNYLFNITNYSPGFSDKNGFGAAANKSLLLSKTWHTIKLINV